MPLASNFSSLHEQIIHKLFQVLCGALPCLPSVSLQVCIRGRIKSREYHNLFVLFWQCQNRYKSSYKLSANKCFCPIQLRKKKKYLSSGFSCAENFVANVVYPSKLLNPTEQQLLNYLFYSKFRAHFSSDYLKRSLVNIIKHCFWCFFIPL